MDISEARRCVAACAAYLRKRDDSPRAAADLTKAVQVIVEWAAQEAITKYRAELPPQQKGQ